MILYIENPKDFTQKLELDKRIQHFSRIQD